MRFPSQSGFTLVELLVTISIITLLTSITAVNVNAARVGARNSARLSDVRNIITAIQAYYVDHGNWPWYPNGDDPRNFFSTGEKICTTGWEPTREGMWCRSKRTCELCNQTSCNGETNWLSPLENEETYFSSQTPRDPISKQNCSSSLMYDYRAARAEPLGTYFILTYDLEMPLPTSLMGELLFCDPLTRSCQFNIRGNSEGLIY